MRIIELIGYWYIRLGQWYILIPKQLQLWRFRIKPVSKTYLAWELAYMKVKRIQEARGKHDVSSY